MARAKGAVVKRGRAVTHVSPWCKAFNVGMRRYRFTAGAGVMADECVLVA